MIHIDYNDNYLSKLHKVLNYKINKHKILYKYYFNKRLNYLHAIHVLKHSSLSEGKDFIIAYSEYYLAKRGINFNQKKLRECKKMISKIHHNYSTKGINGIKKYKYLIIDNIKHI